MLDKTDLISLISDESLPRKDRVLLILSQAETMTVARIREVALEFGLKKARSINFSNLLSRSGGLVAKLPGGWTLTKDGRCYLEKYGVNHKSAAIKEIDKNLRKQLLKIADKNTQDFIQEAIQCHEYGLNRSAIILSWVGAIYLLYDYVLRNNLDEFNDDARVRIKKWKDVVDHDDFSAMSERNFLDTLCRMSVISKHTKKSLIECLDRRNDSAHPNTMKVDDITVAHHISLLLSNVYQPFTS